MKLELIAVSNVLLSVSCMCSIFKPTFSHPCQCSHDSILYDELEAGRKGQSSEELKTVFVPCYQRTHNCM